MGISSVHYIIGDKFGTFNSSRSGVIKEIIWFANFCITTYESLDMKPDFLNNNTPKVKWTKVKST